MMSDPIANAEKKSCGSSKTFIIIGLIFTLLIGGVLGFLFLTPTGKNLMGKETASRKAEKYDIHNLCFTPLSEILLNLQSSDGRHVFLKVTFIIESSSPKISEKIEKLKPIIIDQYQTYLRELDIDDLNGSASVEKMRQELVSRTNSLLTPNTIKNVLFKEFLIQ